MVYGAFKMEPALFCQHLALGASCTAAAATVFVCWKQIKRHRDAKKTVYVNDMSNKQNQSLMRNNSAIKDAASDGTNMDKLSHKIAESCATLQHM